MPRTGAAPPILRTTRSCAGGSCDTAVSRPLAWALALAFLLRRSTRSRSPRRCSSDATTRSRCCSTCSARAPTRENLHQFEDELEKASYAKSLRAAARAGAADALRAGTATRRRWSAATAGCTTRRGSLPWAARASSIRT